MALIPFNKPYLTGKEVDYFYESVNTGKLSGNGIFTKKCQAFFEQKFKFKKCLLTTSGTDALEMCAILCNLKPGDEVIIPSYTFVSSALAFVREGAKIVFADSNSDNPNIDTEKIESLITQRTKVIVPVHYAGIACNMDKILSLAEKYNLLIVEDAAQSIDSYYITRNQKLINKYGSDKIPLGGIGNFAAFSFHETKNITAGGEGGLIVINDENYVRRSEIIWEKGTNRAEFYRGAVNKYGWVDTGSSFLPAEINASFLWAQLECLDKIQLRRKLLWNLYYEGLKSLCKKGFIRFPEIPPYASNNAHMFYLVCRNLSERTKLIDFLKGHDILAPFHYLSLHKSEFFVHYSSFIPDLPNCDLYMDCLIRLPLFYELKEKQVSFIIDKIQEFYEGAQ